MKIRHLFLTLFLLICFSVSAQVDSYQTDIIDYLNNNDTRLQYDAAYDDMFVVLKEQFAVSDVPATVWVELKKDKEKNLDEILILLSKAYGKHFNQDEIKQLDIFFKTETSKFMNEDPGSLTEAQSIAINAFKESDLGRKVEAIKPELTQDVVDISEIWSTEIFSAAMSSLVQNGYHTGH